MEKRNRSVWTLDGEAAKESLWAQAPRTNLHLTFRYKQDQLDIEGNIVSTKWKKSYRDIRPHKRQNLLKEEETKVRGKRVIYNKLDLWHVQPEGKQLLLLLKTLTPIQSLLTHIRWIFDTLYFTTLCQGYRTLLTKSKNVPDKNPDPKGSK